MHKVCFKHSKPSGWGNNICSPGSFPRPWCSPSLVKWDTDKPQRRHQHEFHYMGRSIWQSTTSYSFHRYRKGVKIKVNLPKHPNLTWFMLSFPLPGPNLNHIVMLLETLNKKKTKTLSQHFIARLFRHFKIRANERIITPLHLCSQGHPAFTVLMFCMKCVLVRSVTLRSRHCCFQLCIYTHFCTHPTHRHKFPLQLKQTTNHTVACLQLLFTFAMQGSSCRLNIGHKMYRYQVFP